MIDSRINDLNDKGFCKLEHIDPVFGKIYGYAHLLKHKSNGKKWFTFCHRCGCLTRRYYRSLSLSQITYFEYK